MAAEKCPVCDDDGYIDIYDEDDNVLSRECPRLQDPGHAPFGASGIFGDDGGPDA